MRSAPTQRRSRGCWWITIGIRSHQERGAFFHLSRIAAHFIHLITLLGRISSCNLTQEWFFSAWLCYRGPWRPPVMLSGKRGFCSKMSFSFSLGIWMKNSQHNQYILSKNSLAYIGVYSALLCIVFIWACSVHLIVKTGFVIASASDTPAMLLLLLSSPVCFFISRCCRLQRLCRWRTAADAGWEPGLNVGTHALHSELNNTPAKWNTRTERKGNAMCVSHLGLYCFSAPVNRGTYCLWCTFIKRQEMPRLQPHLHECKHAALNEWKSVSCFLGIHNFSLLLHCYGAE